jgi:4-carboxymuconolactone decarboxylase
MARVGLVNKAQAAPEIREMFAKMEEKGGRVLNVFKVMAHCPQVGYHFLRMGNAILFMGTVPPALRELAILRVGHINGATYEWTHHVPVALRVGVKPEQIEALRDWKDSDKFDEQERAVLQYTDEVTQNIRVREDTFAAVRGFLNEEGMVELTATIGYYGMVCRILEAFQVELESPDQ